jgi:hypothetical protein
MARHRIFVATVALSSLVPSLAFAFEHVSIGGGVIGHAGATFIAEPSDQTLNGVDVDPEYPGFGGLAVGVGGMIDIRFIDVVGIEFDFIRTSDNGVADIEINDNTFDLEVSQGAWHLPLLVKGTYPGKYLNGNLFIGPEFVLPDKPELVVTPANPLWGVIEPDTYVMLTFGLGMEFNIPEPLEPVDFRIPLQLRLSVNPEVPGTRDGGRSELEAAPGSCTEPLCVQSERFYTEWEYQAVISFGASAHF